MESLVYQQTVGLSQNIVEVDLLSDEEDTNDKQSQTTAEQKIHFIVESQSSDEELLDFTFEENYTVNVLSSDSEGEIVGESSETIAIDQSIDLVENEKERTTILTNENILNLSHSVINKTIAVMNSGRRVERSMHMDSDIIEQVDLISDDSDIENEMEIVNILSDDDEPTLNVQSICSDGSERRRAGEPSKLIEIDHSEKEIVNILPNNESILNLTSSVERSAQITGHNQSSAGPRSMLSTYSSCCVIDELLENGFNRNWEQSKISIERRKEIILQGRPFPNDYSTYCTYVESIFKIPENDFSTFQWLTACMSLEILLCWPCSMVFWECKVIYSNIELGINSLVLHGRQPNHKYAEAQYNTWLEEHTQNKTSKFILSDCFKRGKFVKTNGKSTSVNHGLTGKKKKTKPPKMKEQTNMSTLFAKPIITLPDEDFLNIKKTASIHSSKTIILTDVIKMRKGSKKRCRDITAPKNNRSYYTTRRYYTKLGNEVVPVLDATSGGSLHDRFNKTVPITPHQTFNASNKIQLERSCVRRLKEVPEFKTNSDQTKHDVTINEPTGGESDQPLCDIACEIDTHREVNNILSTSNTVIRTALSGGIKCQKSHQESSALASSIDSRQMQSDQVTYDCLSENNIVRSCPFVTNMNVSASGGRSGLTTQQLVTEPILDATCDGGFHSFKAVPIKPVLIKTAPIKPVLIKPVPIEPVPIKPVTIESFPIKPVPKKPNETVTRTNKSRLWLYFDRYLQKLQSIPEPKNISNPTKLDVEMTEEQAEGKSDHPHSVGMTSKADTRDSELDKIACTPSKTVIGIALSGSIKSRKFHQETSGSATNISGSIQMPSDQVIPYNQLESDDVCRADLMTVQFPPLPNILSSEEVTCLSRSLDTSHNQLDPDFDNKLAQPSDFHIFCSMSISGIAKYYMDSAGIINRVVVVDKHGKSVQVDLPSQNPHVSVQNDHNYCKSPKACTPSGYSVEDLIENNFFSCHWTDEQRVHILKNGGPRPLLYTNSSRHEYENMIHEGNHWLVSLKYDVGVACWPCLLFGKIWFVTSKDNFLKDKINLHRATAMHSMSCLTYWIWVDKNIETRPDMRFDLSNELIKCLIDTVCSLQMRIDVTGVTAGDFLGVLQLVTAQDTSLRRELNKTFQIRSKKEIVCSEISTAWVNDAVISYHIQAITESIFKCMQTRIVRELKDADFVCLIMSRAKNQPWVSIMFRYVTSNGDVVERFIRVVRNESSTCITSSSFFLKVLDILEEFQCKNKLVGFALDGAIMKPQEMSRFVSSMTIKYPKAKHFYYRVRDLRTTLLEELSELTNMKVFSYWIYEMMRFIGHNEFALLSLKRLIGSESNYWLPSLNLPSGLILMINNHYSAFVQLFNEIIVNPDNCSSEVSDKASKFLNFLRHFPIRFFIVTLSKIFHSMEGVAEALTGGFDSTGWAGETADAVTSLKSAVFDCPAVFEYTMNTLTVADLVLLEPEDVDYDDYDYFYHYTLNRAIDFLHTKADIVEKWTDSEFKLYYALQSPPGSELCLDLYLNRLLQTYENRWNTDYFMFQLRAVRQMDFFEPLRNDPLRMIKSLKSLDLQETMSEYYKFLELILTVPMVTTATTLNTRGVDRVAAYTAANSSFSTSSWIWINKDLLTKMKLEENFYSNLLSYADLKNTSQCQGKLLKDGTQNIITMITP